MRGLLLTGPTCVGKSTAQKALREHHGFWTPRTCTTRAVEPGETDFVFLTEPDFLQATIAGTLVVPAHFGGVWYGWHKEDLDALTKNPGRAVLNLRPYPALLLQAVLVGFAAVWLTLDEAELSRRRALRGAIRDTRAALNAHRQAEDTLDAVYKSCFSRVLAADQHLIPNLLMIVP